MLLRDCLTSSVPLLHRRKFCPGVESLLDMRDLSLFRRWRQIALTVEPFNQRPHLLLQQLFRSAGDEVVGVTDQMDPSISTFLRTVAAHRVLFPRAPLQTIERGLPVGGEIAPLRQKVVSNLNW
jgi:hypothetical protein